MNPSIRYLLRNKLLYSFLCLLFITTQAHGASAQSNLPYHVVLPIIAASHPTPTPTPSPTDTASPTPIPSSTSTPNPVHTGIATYYTEADGNGACTFGSSPNDLMVAAMNADEYNQASVCGEYVRVTGAKGSITVRIVDLCPGCSAGHLDLSPQAFTQIDDLAKGRVPITWQVISPEISGPILYHFKDGSNQWWTAVQIRNHRNPIAKFEYFDYSKSQYVTVARTGYNYFVESAGMGAGPYKFRVTDVYGNQIVDSGVPGGDNTTVVGSKQFPPGP